MCYVPNFVYPIKFMFVIFLELLDNAFLLIFARHNLTCTEQFELGVPLKMNSSIVQDITRDSDNAVSNTYIILESWLNSRTNDRNSMSLFD